nr:MAG TPA: hypothetical protein [Caudoviricetes sp.]
MLFFISSSDPARKLCVHLTVYYVHSLISVSYLLTIC